MNKKKRIGIVEERAWMREWLVGYLEGEGWEVIWVKGGDELGGLKRLPEVILVDMDQRDGEGMGVVERILEVGAQGGYRLGRVVVMTEWLESYVVLRLKRSGVMGVLDKQSLSEEELGEALERVLAGKVYYATAVELQFKRMVGESRSYYRCLTERELEMAKLFGSGKGNEQVADAMGISLATVQGHRRNILRKLNLQGPLELMCWTMQEGLVKPRKLMGFGLGIGGVARIP